MARRSIPEVNAGSMADIAFLLLIFFLVTTTIETDSGLDRKLPPLEPPDTDVIIKERNLLQVVINKNNQLLVKDELTELKDLRKAAVAFLDNGGGLNDKGEPCDYCQGAKDPKSSVHPEKAVISLQNDRETKYSTYIAVQNELVAAYNELRNRESQRLYKMDFTEMQALFSDPKTPDEQREKLRPRVERIQKMYPQILSEAEPKKN
ncbi:Biopolymer transport protein ExbD [Sinomicrobium oceani]|uniref:Biopolymer transport protein ExbD n=1 Tax=Sinomicrobium oceani TaxID=1150368 RepID=A0A1K1NJA4_9FLAO|nr:biopolymer transporter ExbD [Sinomicrobium oceani]SFW34494.1 Biopolymer transport protein ExbD [Sinomicrobium oceani]